MYNTDVKSRFIQSYSTSLTVRRACISLFNALQRYEEAWGADLCTRSSEVLQPIIDKYVGIRDNARGISVSIIKAYIKWCVDNGVPGAVDGLSGVVFDFVPKIRSQMLANPTHLKKCLDETFNPESDGATDMLLRCFCYLAYMGLPENEILPLRVSDIDWHNMVVRTGGEEYQIVREAVPTLRFCANSPILKLKHPHYETTVERTVSDALMRGGHGVVTLSALRVSLSRATAMAVSLGQCGVSLSYGRLWLSGFFYRAYQQEISGFPPDFESAATDRAMPSGPEMDDGTARAKIKRAARDFERDYEQWKRAFYA